VRGWNLRRIRLHLRGEIEISNSAYGIPSSLLLNATKSVHFRAGR
jgi:hypothetical protein